MSSIELLKRKFHSAFKLSGFIVRREFCALIVEKFLEEDVRLENTGDFDTCFKHLCDSLEKQCVSDKSIEREHIEHAIEVSLHSGYDKNETVINVIGAFEVPKLTYDVDRKIYYLAKNKSQLLSNADSKAELFLERYVTVLQRTRRNFLNRTNSSEKLTLQTVDYLLTLSYRTLDKTVILGSLLQLAEGKYYLEDPTGIVELDLTHAK